MLFFLALILLSQGGGSILLGIVSRGLADTGAETNFWGTAATATVAFLFAIGLVVRVVEWAERRSPDAWRRRGAARERARLAVRRPAEEVPVVDLGDSREVDSDPALPFGDK